ncbi:hypothetical protein DUI87_33358 [Hirundo rustica rustica]|uniref:Uncharacterized protein n=1 Tax=Hirundo rustica rustica TaxID=333673 RepID=A0A3M0IP68_HIRRU|nr:hypothetical protein DUI87_33358 [Hirundo rustica rustica]
MDWEEHSHQDRECWIRIWNCGIQGWIGKSIPSRTGSAGSGFWNSGMDWEEHSRQDRECWIRILEFWDFGIDWEEHSQQDRECWIRIWNSGILGFWDGLGRAFPAGQGVLDQDSGILGWIGKSIPGRTGSAGSGFWDGLGWIGKSIPGRTGECWIRILGFWDSGILGWIGKSIPGRTGSAGSGFRILGFWDGLGRAFLAGQGVLDQDSGMDWEEHSHQDRECWIRILGFWDGLGGAIPSGQGVLDQDSGILGWIGKSIPAGQGVLDRDLGFWNGLGRAFPVGIQVWDPQDKRDMELLEQILEGWEDEEGTQDMEFLEQVRRRNQDDPRLEKFGIVQPGEGKNLG